MGEFSRRQVIGGTMAASAFAISGARALAAEPAAQTAALISKIAITDDNIWIAGMMGKQGPHFFVIDTGTSNNLIDEKLARTLRLDSKGSSFVTGIGNTEHTSAFVVPDLVLGGAVPFNDVVFYGMQKEIADDASGAIGTATLLAYDNDIDVGAGEWRVYPKGRLDRTGLRAIRSRFSPNGPRGRRIYMNANVGGVAGEYQIDTGMRNDAQFSSEATKASGLWNNDRPYAPVYSRRGWDPKNDGRSQGRVVRADRLKIGSFVVERPLVRLNNPDSRKFADTLDISGSIGLPTLSRFNLSIDTKNEVVWVAPSAGNAVEATYPLSGLWVEGKENRLTIVDIGTGSPAKAAGLMVGDVIVGLPMKEYLKKTGGRAGTMVALDYERDGQRKRAEFTLADYL